MKQTIKKAKYSNWERALHDTVLGPNKYEMFESISTQKIVQQSDPFERLASTLDKTLIDKYFIMLVNKNHSKTNS